jgi:hypothetical protein
MPNEFASLPPRKLPNQTQNTPMPMQNTIQKQFHPRRDRAKCSRLERAVMTMALGGGKK